MTQLREPTEPYYDLDPPPSSGQSWWAALLGLIARLVVLGVGGGLAAAIGLVMAMANSQDLAEKPFNFPKPFFLTIWENLPQNDTPEPTATGVEVSPAATPTTNINRQELETEIIGLEQQYTQLQERTKELEQELKLPPSKESLSDRLKVLKEEVEQIPLPEKVKGPIPSGITPSLPGHKLKVTLPSDILFTNNSTISPNGSLLLSSIINDLRQWQGATIRIAAHTDARYSDAESREISFQLSRTVQQHLAKSLPGNYRWIAIGYGYTRPLVINDSDANRQRNRRIEIAVD